MMRSTWLLPSAALILTALPCTGAEGKAVLWQPPGMITSRDWIWGPAGSHALPCLPSTSLKMISTARTPKYECRMQRETAGA